jgi:hypothetical protein
MNISVTSTTHRSLYECNGHGSEGWSLQKRWKGLNGNEVSEKEEKNPYIQQKGTIAFCMFSGTKSYGRHGIFSDSFFGSGLLFCGR